MKNRLILLFSISMITCFHLIAQPEKQLVQVIITPDKADWTYQKGEQAQFQIMVLKNNILLDGIDVNYRINPEMMDAWEVNTIKLKNGKATIKAKRFNESGFLQCHASVVVDGKTYSSYTTVGFSPEEIQPTTNLPADFEQFWKKAKAELAEVPISPILTLMPERCTDKVNVYHVSIDNINGKIYGILCKPKAEGKYPAILHVPGAGIRPYLGDTESAEKGIITLQIGIHGVPVNLDRNVYTDLATGPLKDYQLTNLDDKDNYYFKRVYLGCVRAVDFIVSLDCFNGEDIAVTGGSQGGALSIVTAALDDRINYLASIFPALCDITGFQHGRPGGWPYLPLHDFSNKAAKLENSKYYDVVNFARFVKVPGWYSWGYNDNLCPPTTMYSAYNVITAPKELHIFQETQHWVFPEQQELKSEWIFKKLLE